MARDLSCLLLVIWLCAPTILPALHRRHSCDPRAWPAGKSNTPPANRRGRALLHAVDSLLHSCCEIAFTLVAEFFCGAPPRAATGRPSAEGIQSGFAANPGLTPGAAFCRHYAAGSNWRQIVRGQVTGRILSLGQAQGRNDNLTGGRGVRPIPLRSSSGR
jgi:hypothetical protein